MTTRTQNAAVLALIGAGVLLMVAVAVDSLPARVVESSAPPGATQRLPEVRFERISLSRIEEHGLSLREALYYEKLDDGRVRCGLCPTRCVLREGERGVCKVRVNIGGKLRSLVYGRIVSANLDPIEKKPLYHMLPGAKALSIATAGCNLGCVFCQNWQISQVYPEDVEHRKVTPEWVVEAAVKNDARTIAYTYNEPTIFYEFMYDTAVLARKRGIKNLWITCGYISPAPLRQLAKVLDAANVDLKGFTDVFYREYSASRLAPVLETLKILREEGVWIEITNLIVPDVNDDPAKIREMCQWIVEHLGPDVPLHFSRFHGAYKMRNKPDTPLSTLNRAAQIAKAEGIHYVYIGNVSNVEANSTYCPNCGRLLVQRRWFWVTENCISDSKCPQCGEKIAGIWER